MVNRKTLESTPVFDLALRPNGLKAVPGKNTSGKVLSAQLIHDKEGASLYIWSKATATFHG